MSKRRGSRLFLGQPGMLLVSEDIPGITMPAPLSFAVPLEAEEPDFDLNLFHAQEDEEEAREQNEGPLRVFLGGEDTEIHEDDAETPIFDVSALAMPEGPTDNSPLSFMDDSVDVDVDDIVHLGTSAPPAISMGVSAAVSMDDGGLWDDAPAQPEQETRSTAIIRDQPPAVRAAPQTEEMGHGFDLPETVDASVEDEWSNQPDVEGPAEVVWDEDDTGFFNVDQKAKPGIPVEPPRVQPAVTGESRSFRAIPDKEDPPILPLLIIMIGIAVMAVALGVRSASEPEKATVVPTTEPAPNPVVAPVIRPAPRTESLGQVGEVATANGFLTVESDHAANVYVDDRKVGITPIVKIEVTPGRHRVLAVEVETGKRKAQTADVAQGEERPVRFAFQPVQ
ncbi:MAG: hypothetical protein H8D71_01770 [Deltaproteobacteria bacterium]|nr:hypothetical protein [Deltaproteobacteria bacterium]